MKAKQLFAITALALASGAVFAQEAAPLTRTEAVQQVLDARADGTLRHAGEAGPEEMTPYKAQIEAVPTLTRAQEKTDVLQARAGNQLAHAGAVAPEEDMLYAQAHPSSSTLTRGEVKEEVLEARADGALIPAGQGEFTAARAVYATSRFAKAQPASGQPVATLGE